MTIKVNIERANVGDKNEQLFMKVGVTVWLLGAGQGGSPCVTKDQSIELFYDRRKEQRRSRDGKALPYWTEQAVNGG